MDPRFLVNIPWWMEPLAVITDNNLLYLELLQNEINKLQGPIPELDDNSSIIAELD